jgi:acyl carrier protein
VSRIDSTPASISSEDIADVVASTLGIEDRAGSLTPDTDLLGGLAEFDSMAVLELVTALEARYGLTIEDDEITAEVFRTVGSLRDFVVGKRH